LFFYPPEIFLGFFPCLASIVGRQSVYVKALRAILAIAALIMIVILILIVVLNISVFVSIASK